MLYSSYLLLAASKSLGNVTVVCCLIAYFFFAITLKKIKRMWAEHIVLINTSFYISLSPAPSRKAKGQGSVTGCSREGGRS